MNVRQAKLRAQFWVEDYAAHGPFLNINETEYEGVILEVGLKPVSEYQSVETIVSNPEIAHHLLTDSILYDPKSSLAALQPG